MRDLARIPLVMARIEQLWRDNPDLRLGQLINNAERSGSTPVYYLEDDELMNRLEEIYKKPSGDR